MNKKNFNKGVLLTSFGSFWWGFFGVIYFKYISFAGHVEVLIHRSVWTAFLLIVTTFFFSKWSIFKKILNDKKKLFGVQFHPEVIHSEFGMTVIKNFVYRL